MPDLLPLPELIEPFSSAVMFELLALFEMAEDEIVALFAVAGEGSVGVSLILALNAPVFAPQMVPDGT